MGQKVHPNGIRLGIVKPWNSTWFANTKEFADNLDSDFKVRQYLTKELAKEIGRAHVWNSSHPTTSRMPSSA